jgi:hypothetical protein
MNYYPSNRDTDCDNPSGPPSPGMGHGKTVHIPVLVSCHFKLHALIQAI